MVDSENLVIRVSGIIKVTMPDLPTPTPSPSTKDNGPGQEPPSPTASGGEEKDEINPALSSDEDEGKSAPNCCERCCGSFMTIVAHDAIYGVRLNEKVLRIFLLSN